MDNYVQYMVLYVEQRREHRDVKDVSSKIRSFYVLVYWTVNLTQKS